ncbi:fasciclin domain-containing protein, partial [Methanoculleus chikugoensis]|uniref:fasciclin domain-containing protein n=1 Tax=Methanoculleus chikugoensis TaxID=118126 RepID=UPI001FB55C5F
MNVTPTPTPAVNVTAQIATKLSGEENLTTFVTVINNSTIDQRLQQNVTYVICAPTNEAFAGLGNQTLSAILNDTTLLNNIIDYHTIQGGNYTIEDLVKLCRNSTDGQISLPTVEGTNVNVSITDDGRLIINNNVVVRQIQITNNITVYVIDGVLIPPGTTIPTPPTPPTVNVTPTPTVNVTPTPTVNVTPTPTVNVTPPTPAVNVTPPT